MDTHTQSNPVVAQYRRYIVLVLEAALTVTMLAGCSQNLGVESPVTEPEAVLASYPAAVLGVVVDEKLKVLQVEPDNAAAKAGVQVGDVLDSVDGISLGKDKDKAKDKIHEPKAGKKLKLKLKRADKDLDLDVSPAPPAPHPGGPTPTPVFAPQDYF